MARRPIERKIKQDLTDRFSKRNAVLNTLLKIIIEQEGTDEGEGSSYDKVFGYGKFLKPGQPDPERNTPTANKPISKMTFKEVKEFGRALVNATKGKDKNGNFKIGSNNSGTSAVGAFQLLANDYNTNNPIVATFQKQLGYKDTDIFNEEAQKNIAKELIIEIAGTELNNYIENPSKRNSTLLITRIGKKGSPKNTTDGWDGVTRVDSIGNSTKNKTRLPFGKNAVKKLVETYSKESSSKDTTEDQMENLGLSSERSQTQSNPNEDRINENVDNLVDRFRSIVKEREPEGVFGGAFSVNPDGSITNNEAIDDQEADDVFPNTDTRDEQEAEDIYKFSIPKVERKDTSDSGGGFNIMSKAEASEQPNVSIDSISTDDMFKEMIKTLPRMAKTASKTKKQKIIESIREGLKTPEIEEVESPDIDQEMDRLLRDTSTMDERERAMLTSGMDPELLDDDPPKTEDDLRDASKEDLEAPFIVGTAEEDNRDAALGGDNLFKFDEGEDEDMQPMSFPEEQRDTTIDPFTEDDNLERERFSRQTEDEPEDSGDFSFFRSLFTNEDTDTDFFADEAQPLGGEADPNEDVARFNEGGTADFDGKKEEDDEGDPPPLAKPEEVADDIPAMLSEGEYVLPANVVRYLGLERIMDMHRQVLSEIQQMEDLGMIQNVDKNGEPEEDDKEMKFLEPEEGEEAVSKGTLIIASSKPKGMMCPEPLMMQDGGNPSGGPNSASEATGADNPNETNDTGSGTEDPGRDFGGFDPGPNQNETADIDEFNTKEELDKAKQKEKNKEKDQTELQEIFSKIENPTMVEKGLFGLGRFAEEVLGVEVTEARAKEREAAEAEASQPGDSDDDDINKLVDGDIKEEEIKTTGLEDLLNNNIYIEGVGYVPRSQAGLMSQTIV